MTKGDCMIIGIGVDIIEISRIERLMKKESFRNKIFTVYELEYLSDKRAESAAGYFCVKEAVAKALGTGFSEFWFNDIEVIKTEDGAPSVRLYRKAAEVATRKGGVSLDINVSISHSKELATAVVIAEVGNKLPDIDKSGFPLCLLKKRNQDSHKGNFGKVIVIGGSYSMSGAVALAAKAAFRTGAGLVKCVIPPSIIDRVGGALLEATYFVGNEENGKLVLEEKDMDLLIKEADVIAVGIGMGNNVMTQKILTYLVKSSTKPMVIDADGLNSMNGHLEQLLNARNSIVLTPHEGEMARLTGLTIEFVRNNRQVVAVDFARKYHCIVLLKGHETIVTDGDHIYLNKTGNAGMASGGSGDVLTGIITSLIGQQYSAYDAAVLGAFLHGAGGDLAFEKYGNGLMASDIIDHLGEYLK